MLRGSFGALFMSLVGEFFLGGVEVVDDWFYEIFLMGFCEMCVFDRGCLMVRTW